MLAPFASARLRYRPLAPPDAAGLLALDGNPAVLRYLGTPPLTSIGQARAALARVQDAYRAGALARWAVELRATGEFVGWAGLKLNHEPVNGRTDFVDLGYRLLEPHWGQGYGTEAGRAWLAQGFGALALPLVAGYAEAAHGASRRILEKVGLEFINLFDTADGRPHAWYEAPNPARAR